MRPSAKCCVTSRCRSAWELLASQDLPATSKLTITALPRQGYLFGIPERRPLQHHDNRISSILSIALHRTTTGGGDKNFGPAGSHVAVFHIRESYHWLYSRLNSPKTALDVRVCGSLMLPRDVGHGGALDMQGATVAMVIEGIIPQESGRGQHL